MKIRNRAELEIAIRGLEEKRLLQEGHIFAELKETRAQLSPINMIKNSVKKLTKLPEIQNSLINTITGVGVTVLSKRFIDGKSSSLLKKVLGSFIELAMAKSAVSYTDKIKAYSISIYNNLIKKNSAQKTTENGIMHTEDSAE